MLSYRHTLFNVIIFWSWLFVTSYEPKVSQGFPRFFNNLKCTIRVHIRDYTFQGNQVQRKLLLEVGTSNRRHTAHSQPRIPLGRGIPTRPLTPTTTPRIPHCAWNTQQVASIQKNLYLSKPLSLFHHHSSHLSNLHFFSTFPVLTTK